MFSILSGWAKPFHLQITLATIRFHLMYFFLSFSLFSLLFILSHSLHELPEWIECTRPNMYKHLLLVCLFIIYHNVPCSLSKCAETSKRTKYMRLVTIEMGESHKLRNSYGVLFTFTIYISHPESMVQGDRFAEKLILKLYRSDKWWNK